ncbi:MAG: hypothetical protein HYY04_06530 [Chloroflexi bacterium]|nr:hypothetical protein [Chloroflexota bacterium]
MAKTMTSRERIRAVYRWEEPDTVPVSPDMLIMCPAKLTGKPFWEVYYYQDPPLWRAYVDMVRYYGIDGLFYCSLDAPARPEIAREVTARSAAGLTVKSTAHTTAGPLTWSTYYPSDSPAERIYSQDEDVESLIEKALALLSDPWQRGTTTFQRAREAMGDLGAVGSIEATDPLGWWAAFRGVQQTIYDLADYPEKLGAAFAAYTCWAEECVAATCEKLQPDEVRVGGPVSSLSCISPAIYNEYNIPHIKRVTAVARSYGVPTNLHL